MTAASVETPTTAPPPARDLADPKLYINRELSLLEFNLRVLAQARDPRHPLLERVRFLSIAETNLDEFFMIRVAGLQKQMDIERRRLGPDGMTVEEQLSELYWRVGDFFTEQRRILHEELMPALEAQGIRIVPHDGLTPARRADLRERYRTEIGPILTPLAIDPAHPFPHISNLSLNLLVLINDGERQVTARVKVPNRLPRFLRVPADAAHVVPGEHHPVELVLLEQVIAANLDELFPGHEIAKTYVFQVTRNADLVIQEDEASDLLQAIEDELDQRRFGESVRLVVNREMPDQLRSWLAGQLRIAEERVLAVTGPLGLGQFEELTHLDRPDLLYPPFQPALPDGAAQTTPTGIFDRVAEGDLLLYHPYDSFVPVVDFVRAAAVDSSVLAIKQSLYRVGANSPIVEALLEARDEDTQVAVMVELKARFDEEPNITWARQLEAQGVHVTYGFVGMKTHAKLCIIVRREEGGLRRYVHLGTGNYNPSTARVYTDFSYFTDDPEIAEDVSDLFNSLTGYSKQDSYAKLLVAPTTLRRKLLALIDGQRELAERGEPARVVIKVNHITDEEIIRALYRASGAGVRVEMIVRTTCCLKPGVPGVSENIRVVSLVGRFLEHPRVFCFGAGPDPAVYCGSADLMGRNLDGRVETAFPIGDRRARERILRILALQLRDTVNAWDLDAEGCYRCVEPREGEESVDSQALLLAGREGADAPTARPGRRRA